MALEAHKRVLRRRMRERLRALPAPRRAAAGRSVAELVLAAPEFESAAMVALFAALADEIPTRALFKTVGLAGKVRLLPRCVSEGVLEFAEVESWDELRPGRYGVLEPPPERATVSLAKIALAILPGLAFDSRGHRLGRGRGTYDRTFPPGREGAPKLFGLAFEFQLVGEVPNGPLDRGVDAIVTEGGLSRVTAAGDTGEPR